MLKRELYLNRLRPIYHNDIIKVLVGIRRCGKSTILLQVIEELKEQGIKEDHILYINFENLQYHSIKNELDLYQYIENLIQDEECIYLFFDEIQNVTNFEKAINSFRSTHSTSIFITGSNGKLLSSDLATYLTGRYMELHIYPFTFKEFCAWNDEQITKEQQFQEYMEWGGMPNIAQFPSAFEKNQYLNDLYHSILTRDIVLHGQKMQTEYLQELFLFMVDNIGKTFSSSSILDYMKHQNLSISYPTLQRYIDIFCSAMLFHKVQRYDIRGKKLLTKQEKYYLTDIGLHSICKTSIRENIGPMIENIVFNELLTRGYKIYIGKTYKSEVDFIATRMKEKIYVQVSYLLYDETVVNREFGAYNPIKDYYPKYVISMDRFDFSQNGIQHINLLDFLDGKEL